jgi:hypothetical protein
MMTMNRNTGVAPLEKQIPLAAQAPVAPSAPEKKRKRQSHGLPRLRLQIPHGIPGYYVRWVNDDGQEVEYRLQNDYDFVAPDEIGLLNSSESRVKELVGTKQNGDALYAYLMKIPQDWRDADVQEEEEAQRRYEQQIRKGTIAGDGETAAMRYIPKAGISIT